MKQFIEFVVKSLVEHPGDVQITEANGEDGKTRVLELKCHPDDVGQIIGRNGRTIKALRTLLVTAAARTGMRAVLELADGEADYADAGADETAEDAVASDEQ
ncbi:MAG: KH domain-containing protein [Verrucomicrobia bacterium]|nr:KH domain-containing protein [Verrucomicrobiota bacterium]